MKKTFLILLTTVNFICSNAQTASVRGLYVDGFNSIIGNIPAEDSLLTYAENNDFNYLALYDLWPIHVTYDLTNVGSSVILANFIQKAKQIYNIQQVGAVGENFYFFNSVINVYNQLHSNPLQKFDVYNVEFEFWNTASVTPGNYYCVTYLQPAGYTCDTAGAFAYYKVVLRQVDSLANINGVISETYVGWFNQGQAITIGNSIDRILLHDYINNYSALYTYIKQRLEYIAARNLLTKVIPIFSSEPSFMGPWLSTNTTWQPYNDILSYLTAETGTWKTYIDLEGYQWFDYSNMPPNLFTTGVDKIKDNYFELFPNPAKDEITIKYMSDAESIIELYNSFGQSVFRDEVKTNDLVKINIEGLSPGIYYCLITNSEKHLTKKVIVFK